MELFPAAPKRAKPKVDSFEVVVEGDFEWSLKCFM